MRMTLPAFLLLPALWIPLADNTIPVQEPEEHYSEEDAAWEAAQRRGLERDLALAQAHLGLLGVSQEAELLEAFDALESAREMQQAFTSHENRAETRMRELELMETRESLLFAEEEREQLGLMYEQNGLAEVTAQLVLSRAERQIERTKLSLEIQEEALEYWKLIGSRQQLRELEREVRAAEMQVRLLQATQPVETMEAEHEIMAIEEEIAGMEREHAMHLEVETQ